MKLILATEDFAKNFNLSDVGSSNDITFVLGNNNYSKNIKTLNKIEDKPTFIYDITTSQEKKVYNVIDHINLSGSNPLVGCQKNIKKPFFDISDLYTNTDDCPGVVTHCLGSRFYNHNDKYNYPSTYLCHLAILARATGKTKIQAFIRCGN